MLLTVQRYPATSSQIESLFAGEPRIDNLLEGFLGDFDVPVSRSYPAVDLVEYKNESVVVAELPGVRKEDINVTVKDDMLAISGERQTISLPEKSSWVQRESRGGKFSRTLQLPHDVQVDAISAELTNGMLKIVLPKSEKAQAREIKVI